MVAAVAVEVDAQALRVVRRWPLWPRTLAWSDLRSVDYESGGLRLVRTDRRVFDVDLRKFPEREALLAAVRQHFEFEFEPWPVAQIPAATPSRAQRLQDCAGWGAMLLVIVFIRWAEFELLHGLHREQNLPLLPWQILPVLCVFLLWPKARAWSEKSPVPLVVLLLCMAAYAGNRVVTERSGQEVEAVLLLEETDYEYHRWRVLEPPALASDTTWLARAHPDRQAGARYRVTVRQGWLGDFAIMPEALRAAARVAE